MNETSRRCLVWGIALCVVGSALGHFLPALFANVLSRMQSGTEPAVALLDILMLLVRWTMIPLGTTLIGSAIVIHALMPFRSSDRARDGAEATPVSE